MDRSYPFKKRQHFLLFIWKTIIKAWELLTLFLNFFLYMYFEGYIAGCLRNI